MPYSMSERAFKYAEIYLEELVESDLDTLTWEIADPRDFAHRLRQGIRAAGKLGYDKYKDLLDIYMFKERPNKVIATKRIKQIPVPVGIHKKKFNNVTNLSELITVAISNTHLNVLQFPEVNLNDEEIEQLSKFIKAKNWFFNITSKEIQKCKVQMENESEKVTN